MKKMLLLALAVLDVSSSLTRPFISRNAHDSDRNRERGSR